MYAPTYLASTVIESSARDIVVAVDTASTEDISVKAAAGLMGESKTCKLSAPQINKLLQEMAPEDGTVAFTFDGDHFLVEMSVAVDEDDMHGYVNGALGGSFVMDQGTFTSANIDVADFGSWSLGGLLDGQPTIVTELNKALVQPRADEPNVDLFLKATGHSTIEGGKFVFTTNEHFGELLEAIK